MISDESYLIQLARQDNPAACSQLYDRHYDTVFRYCYYHVGNAETAQDLTGEVFVRMAKNLDVIDVHRRPLLTWLNAIAYSLITLSFNEQHLLCCCRSRRFVRWLCAEPRGFEHR